MTGSAVPKLDENLITGIISEAVGDDVVPLIKILKKKEEHEELALAEKLGVEVNALRNMLYRLHKHNLVKSQRRRDPENGWNIYCWVWRPRGVNHLVSQMTEKNLDSLRKKLNRESDITFYKCQSGCVRLEFDDAFGMDFRCPECGDLMHQTQPNSERIDALKEQIAVLEGLSGN